MYILLSSPNQFFNIFFIFSVAVAELEYTIKMKLLMTFHRDSTFKKSIKLTKTL